MENQDTVEGFNNEKELKMAGFGLRLGALLIDGFIVAIILTVILKFVVPILQSGDLEPSELSDTFFLIAILMYFFGIPLLGTLYQSIFESSKFQGTPGKIAVKI